MNAFTESEFVKSTVWGRMRIWITPERRYRERAAEAEKRPTDSADVYIRIGQVGPRTVLKWRMRGMRLVRKRVSIITAALEEFVVLMSVARTRLSWGLDFELPAIWEGAEFPADMEDGGSEEVVGSWFV